MEPRVPVHFHEHDMLAALRQEGGNGRSGRSAANQENITACFRENGRSVSMGAPAQRSSRRCAEATMASAAATISRWPSFVSAVKVTIRSSSTITP